MSPDAKRQIITALEAFITNAKDNITPPTQYYEVTAFLMLAKKDFLTDKGWEEIAFYIHLCYTPPKLTHRESNPQVA